MSDLSERVRVHSQEVLSNDSYLLKKTTFDFQRSDGTWQRQSRETHDRGNGATILLYNRRKRTVILTRQFRYPAFVNGYRNLLIETPAGLLDERSPEEAIRKETAEETGYVIQDVHKVFEAFMSPVRVPHFSRSLREVETGHKYDFLNHKERFVLRAKSHVCQRQANMGHPQNR